MQNNIVYNTTEEVIKNVGVPGEINFGPNSGMSNNFNTVVHQQILGQQYHQHGEIAGISGSMLPVGTVISETQYISNAQYVTNPQLTASQSLIGVPPIGTKLSNLGTSINGIYGTNVTKQELLGAGVLGAGVTGAGALESRQLHHQGLGTTTATGLVPNTALNGNFIGTFIFRPLEAKLIKDKEPAGKINPYCKFKIGFHNGKSSIAKGQGINPVWNDDVISLNRKHNEQYAKVKIKDKDRLSLKEKLGEAKIPLTEVATRGRVKQWFNVYKKEQLAGEILLDVEFQHRAVF